jgi:hypothetical protein
LSKVNDMLASQRPGTLIEVPGGNPLSNRLPGLPGEFGRELANALGDVIEGRPLYTAEDTKPGHRTVLARLDALERQHLEARSEWAERHTALMDRNRELEARVAQLRAELGTPEP